VSDDRLRDLHRAAGDERTSSTRGRGKSHTRSSRNRPSETTRIRSPSTSASSISCVTNTIVVPVPLQRVRSTSCNVARVTKSSAPNGSSMIRMPAPVAKTVASATRLRMPPESSFGQALSTPESPTATSHRRANSCRALLVMPLLRSPNSTLSRTRSHGKTVSSWNTITRSSPGPVTGAPSAVSAPALGGTRPASARTSVDLPPPERPTIQTNWPLGMMRSTPCNARTRRPSAGRNSTPNPRNSICAAAVTDGLPSHSRGRTSAAPPL
jgi:hypothetical protein